MTENTKIEWADHTFNPWWGCTEVSPGCDHCYARTWATRYGMAVWGKGVVRRTFGPKHWAEPLKWDAAAARDGVRRSVFCASMADVFDVDAPAGELDRLWALIRSTPHLDWLLLTKRPNQVESKLPEDWGEGYENVWLGTSVESPDYLWRAAELRKVKAVVRFLSCEPLLAALDLRLPYPTPNGGDCATCGQDWTNEELDGATRHLCPPGFNAVALDWVIVGGESGPGARPMDVAWVRSLVAQCRAAGVAVFVKQLGAKPWNPTGDDPGCWKFEDINGVRHRLLDLRDRKGGDMSEWPADLRVREFPR